MAIKGSYLVNCPLLTVLWEWLTFLCLFNPLDPFVPSKAIHLLTSCYSGSFFQQRWTNSYGLKFTTKFGGFEPGFDETVPQWSTTCAVLFDLKLSTATIYFSGPERALRPAVPRRSSLWRVRRHHHRQVRGVVRVRRVQHRHLEGGGLLPSHQEQPAEDLQWYGLTRLYPGPTNWFWNIFMGEVESSAALRTIQLLSPPFLNSLLSRISP